LEDLKEMLDLLEEKSLLILMVAGELTVEELFLEKIQLKSIVLLLMLLVG